MIKLHPMACAVQLALLGMLATAPVAYAQSASTGEASHATATRQYDIPAGPLGPTISRFASVAGVAISFDASSMADKTSPGLKGSYNIDRGFASLLQGSGWVAVSTGGGNYVLKKSSSESNPINDSVLPAVTVKGAQETATGPVKGYVAGRSVTGTKTDTPILEIPQSISIVTKDQIEDIGAQKLRDVLNYTAGINAVEGADRMTDGFVIRGFQGTSFGSVYRDGMKYMANVYDGVQEPYGAERVELLRGASSILFGQTSPGGVVNVVSKQPTAESLHEIRAEYGSHNRKQIATDHGGALNEDASLTYRLTALVRDSDTMVDYVKDDRLYIAPSIRWQPNAATSLILSASYQKSKTAYVYGLPAEGTILPNPNGKISSSLFTGEPGYSGSDATFYDIGYRFEHALNDSWKFRQNLRYFHSENELPSLNLGGFVAGTNQSTVTRAAQDRWDEGRMLTVDTQLEGRFRTGDVSHTLLTGLDYTDRESSTLRYNKSGAPLNLYAPVYGGGFGAVLPALNSSVSSSDRIGLYMQDQIKWDRWVVLLGLRHEKAKDNVFYRFANATQRTKADATTARAGLVYLFDNGLAPFISFSQSFEPVAGASRLGNEFKPTEGEQYEIGVRWQPAGSRTMLSAAVYQLTQKNVSTPDPVAPTQFNVQTGEIQSKGIELEAKTELIPQFDLTAAYAYTDAEITQSNRPVEVGQRRGATPRHMASVWGMYRFNQVGAGALRAGAGIRYVGGTTGLFNAAYVVPSYTVGDLMASYEMGPWQFMLRVNNVADKEYIASCTYACFYGERRMATASVGYRW